MKTTKHVLSVVLLLALLGCNAPESPSSPAPASESQTVTSLGAPVASIRTAVIQSGGQTVAYVVGLLNYGQMLVYIPSQDVYAQIDPYTGKYSPSLIYYTGASCTGTPFIGHSGSSVAWYGEIGKSVVFDGTSYYKVTADNHAAGTANSYCNNTTTWNYGSATVVSDTAELTASSRPYNFEAIAPLTVVFQ